MVDSKENYKFDLGVKGLMGTLIIIQAPVVWRLDNAILWINLYTVDNAIFFAITYTLDSDIE